VPPEDGVLRVIVESENTGVLVDPVNLHLEEFNAQPLDVGLNSVPLADTLYWTCLRADTFHLRLAMPTYTDCGVSYRLRYDILPGFFATEEEPNNSITEAINLPLATEQEGHLGFLRGPLNTDWYDYYHIVLPDDGDLRVIISSENAGTVSNAVNLSLEGIDQQTIDMDVSGALFTDTLIWSCLTPGPYDLKLAMPTATDCGITYRMRCELLAPIYANDPEPNDEIPLAVTAVMGVPVDGHLRHGWLTGDLYDTYRVVKSDTGHFRIVSEAYTLQSTGQQLTLEVADHTWTPIGSFTALMGSNGIVLTDTSTVLNAPVDTLFIRVGMGTGACGAYRLWFGTVSTVGLGPDPVLPSVHALQVFPNPAVEELDVSYALASAQPVRIRLLDMHGRVVHTMAEEVKPPGDQHTVIDTRPLASGAYTVEVSASDGTGARQLVHRQQRSLSRGFPKWRAVAGVHQHQHQRGVSAAAAWPADRGACGPVQRVQQHRVERLRHRNGWERQHRADWSPRRSDLQLHTGAAASVAALGRLGLLMRSRTAHTHRV